MEMVREELGRDPELGLQPLYERARSIDSGIGDLSLRQFHGRYALQVKREMAGARKRSGRRPAATRAAAAVKEAPPRRRAGSEGGSERESVRRVFLEFAGAFAQADTRPEIVRLLSGIDVYVDRIEGVYRRGERAVARR
jgi:hypothetical protein